MRSLDPGRGRLRGLVRRGLGLLLLLAALVVARPAFHLARVALRGGVPPPPAGTGLVEDAGRLEATTVSRVIEVPADPDAALSVIRDALAEARSRKLHVSIAGARHTMGGQTIARNGIVL